MGACVAPAGCLCCACVTILKDHGAGGVHSISSTGRSGAASNSQNNIRVSNPVLLGPLSVRSDRFLSLLVLCSLPHDPLIHERHEILARLVPREAEIRYLTPLILVNFNRTL